MAVNMVRSHSRDGTQHILNLSFAQFQADRDVVTTEALLERKRRELALLERSVPDSDLSDPEQHGESASAVEAEISLRSLRPGDVVLFDAANVRGRGLVLATASRRSGIRLTIVTPSRKLIDVTAKDLRSLPIKGPRVDLPVPFEPTRTEFIKEAVVRLVRAKLDESSSRVIAQTQSPRIKDAPTTTSSMRRLRKDIEKMQQQTHNRAGSVSARFMDVVDLLTEMEYISDWSLTDKGEVLSGIFHESDLLVVETMNKGIFDNLSVPDLVGVASTLIFEPRGGDTGPATRWPSDLVRQRFKRIEKLSQRLNEAQRSHGLHMHRPPHGGLASECAAWSIGKPLSKILDPDLTPGDFVRSIRQLIDLLRQIAQTTHNEQLRAIALQAIDSLNRGVVAATQAGQSS
jgi:ATP-dependent RNA helicase HelY